VEQSALLVEQAALAGKQAEETARQGKTLLVFTIITIVFVCARLSVGISESNQSSFLSHLWLPSSLLILIRSHLTIMGSFLLVTF
jgi:hypothetical protein